MPCVIDVIGLGILRAVCTSDGRCLLMFTTSLGEMPYLQMPLAEVVTKISVEWFNKRGQIQLF